jgi:uncharacterized protein YwqG
MEIKTHKNLTIPKLPANLEIYRKELEKLTKPAWLLKCSEENEPSTYHTHIKGFNPFVPEEKGWPCCSKCKRPLYFVCQINFTDFLSQVVSFNKGLFQFFYCWDCMPMPNNDFGLETRWYPDFDLVTAQTVVQANCPHSEDELEAYASLAFEFIPFLSLPSDRSKENPIPDDVKFQAKYNFINGLYLEDKMISRIGGYPPWFQPISEQDYLCSVCGSLVEFVLAIGSDDTDIVWYDSGYWYFFACSLTSACGSLHKPLMDCHFY